MVDFIHWLIIKWVLQTYLWKRYQLDLTYVVSTDEKYIYIYIYTHKQKQIFTDCVCLVER